jgi:hypothetical protein
VGIDDVTRLAQALPGVRGTTKDLRSADVSRAWYADLWFDLLEWAVPW